MVKSSDPFANTKTNKVSSGNPFEAVDSSGNIVGDDNPQTDISDLFAQPLSEPDRLAQIKERQIKTAMGDNNHISLQNAPAAQGNMSGDQVVVKSKDVTSPMVSIDAALGMLRVEEIENELVRKIGRYIPNIDNVKPGVPFSTHQDERVSMLDGITFKVPLINNYNINSDGITVKGGDIFDTGTGAQVSDDFATNKSANPNDPRSESFMACSNMMCQYREGCLRFRLKNRRANSFPFFPESCRKDGIYISINESDYTGYDHFDVLSRGASNVTKLPNP